MISFVTGLELGEYDILMGIDDLVENAMREIDSNPDTEISEKKFIDAISEWVKKAKVLKV